MATIPEHPVARARRDPVWFARRVNYLPRAIEQAERRVEKLRREAVALGLREFGENRNI